MTPYTDISLTEMDALRQKPGTLVVDVRDEWEFEEFNLGGLNLPLPDIRARHHELLAHDPLILLCTNGVRSRVAAKDLRRQPAFSEKTMYHVAGGIVGEV
jgi:rhodanese-related sulfurtransferase